MLFGFNLIHRALFVRYNLNNTRTILIGIAILSIGISASGIVEMYIKDSGSYLTIVLLYSVIGGYGYHLVFSKMWKILDKIFNAKKEMFVIKFLHSFGQSISSLFLLTVIHWPWEDFVYGALLVMFGGILLNLIPLTILIENEKNFLKLDQDSLVKITEKGNESFYNDVAKNYTGTQEDVDSRQKRPVEAEQIPMMSWKNPANYSKEDNLQLTKPMEGEYDEETFARDGKYFNSDGVEILEIIVEEDDENIAQYEAATSHVPQVEVSKDSQWLKINQIFTSIAKIYNNIHLVQHINTRIIKSVRFAFTEPKFYSCLLFKSTDLCVFVLFLTILAKFMSFHYYHRAKSRQMLLLSYVTISSSWTVCSLLLLWCDIRFRKQHDKLLIFSILFKAFGYFCVYSTKSSFWTVTGCVLIGVSHAIACSYQDLVIKQKFSARQWNLVKGALCFVGGMLIVVLASLVNVAYVYCRIDNVLLVLLLVYCISGSTWITFNYRIVLR
ncbi:uncharacterized protein LOC129776130 isoform X2 [Toxorhynchites rutilus septentrionalis]|nr:uncharacterized protein LOC129776130 isoform X2 [Toxorhynchites rutilus septentrionalis]XP_055637559.1 uncharacterized protein LOC129776130 isoform X2 [Toxorhynchites rutilus septentrionalis]